ncbi:monocarboxylate transporter 13-like [Rhipicephalus microplus]|uniref:monocarboxylate transporter 13-like n=1 Tax=Rhipicephalus microplus TaxID=6941 RepID=UPI003F6D68A2
MASARTLKDDPRFGADSRWSWISAFACCCVLFLALATPRIVGIFFYGIIETFMVTREDASWPVSLAATLMVLPGPIVGNLCERYSIRAVLLTSSSLAGIGTSLCYLAGDLIFITISFGVIQGCALCGLYVSSTVLLAQHFEKRRATAISVVLTVCGLNTVVIPPLIEYFRTEYGIRGAFLLYGAVMLHAIPSVIILRSPVWLVKPKRATKEATHVAEKDRANATCVLISETDEHVSAARDIQDESGLQHESSICYHTDRNPLKPHQNGSTALHFQASTSLNEIETNKITRYSYCSSTARQFLTLTFLIHGLSFATVIFTTNVFSMIPADLARDRGIDPSDSVYVLQAFSIGDVAFRAVVGLVIDSRTLSLESVMLIGFVLQGLAFEWLAWAGTLELMIAAAVFLGTTSGSRMCLQAPALIMDFGISTLPVMMGGLSFCSGVSMLLLPPLIGYFRDSRGDYSGLLHSMAALNAFFVCVWAFKVVSRRTAASRLPSKSAQSSKPSKTDSPRNCDPISSNGKC